MTKLKTNRGFTLIELLVVIAIIGILSSVILTSLSNARERAKGAKIQQELKQLSLVFEIYYAEYGGYPFREDDGQNGQYCVTFDANVECYRNGQEITARLSDINDTIAGLMDGVGKYNDMVAAAVEFPRYREFISFGEGNNRTQGYVYQECFEAYTMEVDVNGDTEKVCVIDEDTATGNGPFLTYPVLENGQGTFKYEILGRPGEDYDPGGTI